MTTCPVHDFELPCPSCDFEAGISIARTDTDEHTETLRWNDYRINFLTANGWHYAGPGAYVHRVTGNEFHPYEPVPQPDGTPLSQWRVLASKDRAPDPNKTHIERRRKFYDNTDNH